MNVRDEAETVGDFATNVVIEQGNRSYGCECSLCCTSSVRPRTRIKSGKYSPHEDMPDSQVHLHPTGYSIH